MQVAQLSLPSKQIYGCSLKGRSDTAVRAVKQGRKKRAKLGEGLTTAALITIRIAWSSCMYRLPLDVFRILLQLLEEEERRLNAVEL